MPIRLFNRSYGNNIKTLLNLITPVLYRSRSAIAKGDVFSVLVSSLYIIRGSKFAVANSALDYLRAYGIALYAIRY